MSDDDEVGYGKPPKHTQFKPGQSGNPEGGKPRKAKSLRELSLLQGNKRHRVQLNGKTVTITQREIAVIALWKKALKGDIKAFQEIQRIEADPNWNAASSSEFIEREIEVRLVLDEKPLASYCDDCGKALDERIEAAQRKLSPPTEH